MTTTFDDHDIRVALADASLDAPRVDLWERIDEQVIGLSRKRRPFRQALRSLAAVVAILLAGAGMLTVYTLAGDDPDRRALPLNAVPDLLLLSMWDEQTRSSSLGAFLPESDGMLTLLEGVYSDHQPAISHDGRQLVYSGWEQDGDTWVLRARSLNSATLATEWQADILSEPVQTDGGNAAYADFSAVITGDRVYVSAHSWGAPGPIAIRALDRDNGEQTGEWTIDIGERLAGTPSLWATPDGSQLFLVAQVWDGGSGLTRSAYVAFDVPEMVERQRVIEESSTPAHERFYAWNANPIAGGRSLYAINGGRGNEPTRIDFLDLTTGRLASSLPIAFSQPIGVDSVRSLHAAISHDGRSLYLFDALTGELVTVDLVERKLRTTAVIDLSDVQRSAEPISGYMPGSLQLSPDGKRLYAIGVDGGEDARTTGVVVIDTASGQVAEHWLPEVYPIDLAISGDGKHLYVQTTVWQSRDGEPGVRVIETATGAEVFFDEDLNRAGSLSTVADVYRAEWGVSPEVVSVDLDDLSPSAFSGPYARMAVDVSAATALPGDSVTVELRYLHPVTGEPLTDDAGGVRFDEPEHVRAILTADAASSERTIVLNRSADGVYRGAAILATPGSWSVQVIAERTGQPARYAIVAEAVIVQPDLRGSDGRRYILSVTNGPASPAVQQEVRVRVSVVDAETGAPLPEGVELPGGMPETLRGSIFLGDSGVSSRSLTPIAYGVYEGPFHLFASGRWVVTVDFPQDGVASGGIAVGVVVVVE